MKNSINENSSYPIEVDYDQSLQKMIDEGNYGEVDPNIIQQNFPLRGKGEKAVELVLIYDHLNRWSTTDRALQIIKEQGLRTTTLPELLAFGAKYPEFQRQYSIAALGSVWVKPDGDYMIPWLHECRWGKRCLGLHWYTNDWHRGFWRFLAAPSKPSIKAL